MIVPLLAGCAKTPAWLITSPSDWLQRDRSFPTGRSRLTFCPSGYETENGSLELLEVVNRLIHKWTLRYHAPFSLNLAGIGFGLTSPIIKSLSGKDCSRVYPKYWLRRPRILRQNQKPYAGFHDFRIPGNQWGNPFRNIGVTP